MVLTSPTSPNPLREKVALAVGSAILPGGKVHPDYRRADDALAALGLEPSGEYVLVKREDLEEARQALALTRSILLSRERFTADAANRVNAALTRLQAALHPEQESTDV